MAVNTLTRRELLKWLGAGSVVLGWPNLTAAASGRTSRLIVVILRGGMDGLAAVPAYGEPQLASLRGALNTGPSLKLDGTFAMHPALAQCARMYHRGELAVVHAVAPPYHGRSHFEAQDCLENGSSGPHLTPDGWLNRAVGAVSGAEGLAVASSMPLILRGNAPAETWSPSPIPQPSDDLAARIAPLYARDKVLGPAFRRATRGAGMGREQKSYRQRLSEALRDAAKFMGGRDGLRVVMVQDGGWDTHARQGAAQGLLAGKLAGLDEALATAHEALGPLWRDTAIVVATEFGRTVRANGSGGTDHGTGGVMLMAGGAIKGGRVLGDWPGLSNSALLDGRDLRPTTDSRAVFKGLLREHLGVPEGKLASQVFPDSAGVRAMETLVRGT